jgi:hypothetical protein
MRNLGWTTGGGGRNVVRVTGISSGKRRLLQFNLN